MSTVSSACRPTSDRICALVLSPQRPPGATLDLPPADAVWLTPALPPRDYCADLRSQMTPQR